MAGVKVSSTRWTVGEVGAGKLWLAAPEADGLILACSSPAIVRDCAAQLAAAPRPPPWRRRDQVHPPAAAGARLAGAGVTVVRPPCSALRPFVRSLGCVGGVLPPGRERILPTATVSLMVNLHEDEFRT